MVSILNQKINDFLHIALGKNRRQYERRENDMCVAVINDQTVPVENWSLGGALVQVDDRLFEDDQNIDITLRFKVGERIMNIHHTALIIRKSPTRLALKFMAISNDAYSDMQEIICRSIGPAANTA